MNKVTGKTKQLGIIGCPADHSFSPVMHNFISECLGLDYIYCAWRVEPGHVREAADGIRAMNIAGINVTAPHKYEIMKYLDEVSEQARLLGSVNTVVNRGGRLIGYNTDADGFLRALEYEGVSPSGARVLLLGAGGAAKPLCVRLAQSGIKSIDIVNRTYEKAAATAEYVRLAAGFKAASAPKAPFGHYDLVINTTSAGMEPQLDKCPIEDMSFIDKDTFAADIIYNPEKTLFLRRAEELGAGIMNGLGMLICQGLSAYELFTGAALEEDMYRKIKRELFGA